MAPPDKSVHWKQGQHLCIVISDLCSSWLEVNNNHLFTLCTLRHERMMTEQASDQRQTRKHTYPHTTCLSLTLSVCRTSIGNRNITRFPTSLYSSLYSTVCCNHFTYVCAPCVMLRSYLRRCQLWPATWLGTNWEWVIFIACNCTHIWKYTVIWSGLIKKKSWDPCLYFVRLWMFNHWIEADDLICRSRDVQCAAEMLPWLYVNFRGFSLLYIVKCKYYSPSVCLLCAL